MEEYKGDFIFTENNPPPELDANTWQELWDQFNQQFQAGQLPINSDKKIPQALHHIYYCKSAWERYEKKLPLRSPSEIKLFDNRTLKDSLQIHEEKFTNDENYRNRDYIFLEYWNPSISLIRADLTNTQLSKLVLCYSLMQGVELQNAKLEKTDLYLANLQRSCIQGVQVLSAWLWDAEVQGIYLLNNKFRKLFIEHYKSPSDFFKLGQLKGATIYDKRNQASFDFGNIIIERNEVKEVKKTIKIKWIPDNPFIPNKIRQDRFDFYQLDENGIEEETNSLLEGD